MYMLNDYACLQALVNKALTWQSGCVTANYIRKQQNLFVQGYNHTYLAVHFIMKHAQKSVSI